MSVIMMLELSVQVRFTVSPHEVASPCKRVASDWQVHWSCASVWATHALVSQACPRIHVASVASVAVQDG